MSSDWHEVSLRELVEVFDGPHATPALSRVGPVFLGISNLVHGRIDLSDVKRISEDDYRKWTRRVEPRPGDIVFSYETRLGEAALVPVGLRCCLGRRMGLLRPQPKKVDSRFLLYAFLGPDFQETIRAATVHGSTVDRIALTEMPGFPIKVPRCIDEQRAIAHVLGSLDDKIDLSRRMNQTLESMAAALFKSWFVDFDPVRAKSNGQSPNLPQHLSDLFPTTFADSEPDQIPASWRVAPFADIVDVLSGGTPKTSVEQYWDGDIPWFSVVDAPSTPDVWVLDTRKKVTPEGVENSSTRVLPVGTTIISARGTVGRVALVGVPMAMNQSCYGLRGKTGEQGFFTYYSSRELASQLQQHAHGSVFDTITRATLSAVNVVVPPQELINAFEQQVGPSLERIRSNAMESQTLSTLRDTLLPKLISGELRIPDAERIVSETT